MAKSLNRPPEELSDITQNENIFDIQAKDWNIFSESSTLMITKEYPDLDCYVAVYTAYYPDVDSNKELFSQDILKASINNLWNIYMDEFVPQKCFDAISEGKDYCLFIDDIDNDYKAPSTGIVLHPSEKTAELLDRMDKIALHLDLMEISEDLHFVCYKLHNMMKESVVDKLREYYDGIDHSGDDIIHPFGPDL